MKRYRLTRSGICDCMIPDIHGDWVKYDDVKCYDENPITPLTEDELKLKRMTEDLED